MLASALIVLCGTAVLVTSTPLTTRQGATVVKIPQRRFAPSPERTFSLEAARIEKQRIHLKYPSGPNLKRRGKQAEVVQRRTETKPHFDIQLLKRGSNGSTVALVDFWTDNIDEGARGFRFVVSRSELNATLIRIFWTHLR